MALAKLGGFEGVGAGDFEIVGGLVDVSQIGEEREVSPDGVFAGEVDVGAFRSPRVGARFEAATVDDALTLAAEVVPIQAEIVGRA